MFWVWFATITLATFVSVIVSGSMITNAVAVLKHEKLTPTELTIFVIINCIIFVITAAIVYLWTGLMMMVW